MRTRSDALETMLTQLQRDVEAAGSEEVRRRRRLIMKGIRICAWSLEGKAPLDEVEQELRAELFASCADPAYR